MHYYHDGGFFMDGVSPSIPNDALPLGPDEYAGLIRAQSAGANIELDADGRPVAVFAPEPTAADRLAAHASAVSAECRRRIYAAASAEAQMNMATAAAIIGAKTASSRTPAEAAIIAGTAAALQWVVVMRETYRALAADPAADYLADAAWPPLDEAVRAMIAANF